LTFPSNLATVSLGCAPTEIQYLSLSVCNVILFTPSTKRDKKWINKKGTRSWIKNIKYQIQYQIKYKISMSFEVFGDEE